MRTGQLLVEIREICQASCKSVLVLRMPRVATMKLYLQLRNRPTTLSHLTLHTIWGCILAILT